MKKQKSSMNDFSNSATKHADEDIETHIETQEAWTRDAAQRAVATQNLRIAVSGPYGFGCLRSCWNRRTDIL
jgi:hypothetical protein